jgi:hypothetical protein
MPHSYIRYSEVTGKHTTRISLNGSYSYKHVNILFSVMHIGRVNLIIVYNNK